MLILGALKLQFRDALTEMWRYAKSSDDMVRPLDRAGLTRGDASGPRPPDRRKRL